MNIRLCIACTASLAIAPFVAAGCGSAAPEEPAEIGSTAEPVVSATFTGQAVADTIIFSESDNIDPSDIDLIAGRLQDKSPETRVRRSLVRFDLRAGSSPIPTGATVTSVQLAVVVNKGHGANMEVHRLTKTWAEGSTTGTPSYQTGLPPVSGAATWNFSAYSSTAWATPGGDSDANVSANFTGSAGTVTLTSTSFARLKQDVQGWVKTPSSNNGWLIRAQDETTPAAGVGRASQFASGPTLTVNYTVECTGTTCTDDGNSCTNDVCTNGLCTHPAKNNGVTCA